ncbi:hypothetical protein D3C80_1173040 [compost metagenome]
MEVTVEIAPVKSFFFTLLYPTFTSTSRKSSALNFKTTLIVPPFFTLTVCVTYPINEIERVEFAGASTAYFPSKSVEAVFFVAVTIILAPGIDNPFSSDTVPETFT